LSLQTTLYILKKMPENNCQNPKVYHLEMNRREAIKLITGSVPGLAIAGREFKQEPKPTKKQYDIQTGCEVRTDWVVPKCTHLFIYIPRISNWRKAELKKAFEEQYKGVQLAII